MRERSLRARAGMTGFTPRQQLGLIILLGISLLPRAAGIVSGSRAAQTPAPSGFGRDESGAGPKRPDTAAPSQGRLFLLGHRLNLNRATPADLTLLPRIGPKRAEKILKARSRRHGFRSVDELSEIPGLGPVLVDGLRPLVWCGDRTSP